jgi:PPP family 3-phenylpropionic acid transporter
VRDAPADMAMFTQMIYSALQAGVFMGLATLASGWLYDHVGAGGYWLSAALAAAGFALIWRLRST